MIVQSQSVDATLSIGAVVGRCLEPGLVVALNGGLGAGKTCFVKGVACGNETPAEVTVNSPTFVLVNEYPGKCRLHHIDLYRLHGADEAMDLGLAEMAQQGGVLLIEWAERLDEDWPTDFVRIEMSVTGPTSRQLVFGATGPASKSFQERLAVELHA